MVCYKNYGLSVVICLRVILFRNNRSDAITSARIIPSKTHFLEQIKEKGEERESKRDAKMEFSSRFLSSRSRALRVALLRK